ncbi:response regulator transcription factor [Streptomyces clavuligerus]|uniref:Putative two-component system response regulator n=1 Tax=Streptomyces clavuligerus TaxID=1901 RepID=B5GRB1_STRCL|nr:response regulator transcription factor [Streptomyces clavuligerus]EDY48857.1 two-component system response regulator [Streptomyces clavuligerus]EFG03963.1 Putative two-component system response regulator [Streptomyces clavuligerus]MBY6307539.1 response regulator transcription factor [Streptomyces clavuligerus]QCS09905.1 DNA-binding response regulator [Streptomyces clavuligerus]QPJ98049.1 response regulator [Streptomyces clavuligerus]
MLRIVLAEDSVLLREGLVGIMERFGHQVLAGVGTADELIAAVAEHDPDIVVTDVRMPPGFSDEGLRAALRLREKNHRMPILVLSQYVQRAYAEELLDSSDGTHVGYLLKERVGNVEEFVEALQRVAAGATVVDPEVVRQLLRHRRDPLAKLTPREQEVLALMAEGQSNASVAASLHVSEGTVSKHFGSILTKLDLSLSDATNRRVLAVLAYLRG